MTPAPSEPNPELLRAMGWTVRLTYGNYCMAWRGNSEFLFVWTQGQWHRADGGEVREAA